MSSLIQHFSLKRITIISLLIWVIVQLFMIQFYQDVPQRSDQGAYMAIATECFKQGVWYPSTDHVYSSYIWAPGFINWLILQLHVFGTLKVNMYFNLLMNLGIVMEVAWLSRRFFSQRTACLATIVYCLIYSNTWATLPCGTEISFLFLALSAFCLVVSGRLGAVTAAGLLFFLANWIRPLVVIFLFTALFYMWRNRYTWKKYLLLLLPFFLSLVVVGSWTQSRMGFFNYQSTTGGINLIMTSNDRAYGGVATSLTGDSTSTCYIADVDKYTFAQRDSIWKARSVEWIKEHPFRYSGLYLLKIGGLMVEDSWADRPILGGDGFVDQAAHGNKDKSAVISRIIHMASKSMVYYLVIVVFLITLWKRRSDILTAKGYVLLILVLGVGATCLFSVSPRYHHPFLFVCIIWAAYGIDTYLSNQNGKRLARHHANVSAN